MDPAIYDTILWLRARNTGKRFPTVEFSADTDMATTGLVSLTSVVAPKLIVTHMTGEEWASKTCEVGGSLVEKRMNHAPGRSDLKCKWLVRNSRIWEGHRFHYRDIFERRGSAVEVERTTLIEFERSGGKLTLLL